MKHARRLTLDVVECKGLPDSAGDPLVELKVGDKKRSVTEKTKPQKKAAALQWNEHFEIVTERHSDLVLSVLDSSKNGGDPVAVSATLSVSDYDGKTVDKWFPLHKAPKSKQAAGEIHLRIHVGKPDEKPPAAPTPAKPAATAPTPATSKPAAEPAGAKAKTDGSAGNHTPAAIAVSAPTTTTALGPGFGTGFGTGTAAAGGAGFTGGGSMRPSPASSAPTGAVAKSAPPKEETKDIFYFIRENDFAGLSNFLKNPAFDGINSVDSYGYTPLQSACSSKDIDDRIIMRLLQVPGIDVATPIKSDKNTALHYFCQTFKLPLEVDTLLQMFIKLGADVNARNSNNETPIFKAIWNNSIRLLLVERLLEAGADVNVYTHSHSEGVLHYAVRFQRDDLMSILLRAGADLKVKGKVEHKTPLELAQKYGPKALADRLEQVEELYNWLDENGLSQFRLHFIRKDLVKSRLHEVDKALLHDMGITDVEDVKKIKKALKQFKAPKDDVDNNINSKPAAAVPTTKEAEDSSKNLQKIIAELDKLNLAGGGSNRWIIEHKDLEFTKKLGAGAAGDVFSGLYKGKPVAIKVLKENMEEKELAEFKKEFQILCSVHSPYTVHFFGACLAPKLCMVMELCSRGSLCDLMKSKEMQLGWSQFFNLALETTAGLEVLHSFNIVHRDLKSLNYLVTGDMHVKVCDYGLSRFDTQANDETLHQLRGTMAFCAPEVYHSSKFTSKSDVYSLVMVLWELVVRTVSGKYQAPYSEYKHLQYDFQIIIQVAKKGLRPTIPATVPAGLQSLLKRGMDAEPEKRPSVKEVVVELNALQQEYEANRATWDKAIQANGA